MVPDFNQEYIQYNAYSTELNMFIKIQCVKNKFPKHFKNRVILKYLFMTITKKYIYNQK